MPKKGLTAILYVLDRSGSMESMWGEAVGAFDQFLSEQQAIPSEAEFGLTDFDNQITRHPIVPLRQARKLSEQTAIAPRGMTALLDAVGRTVDGAGADFAARPEEERPERVLLVIQTDGLENSSREYTPDRLRQMLDHQKAYYSWEVIFLGADQDAWAVGRTFAAAASLRYDGKKAEHLRKSAAYLGENARSFRSTGHLKDLGPKDLDAT